METRHNSKNITDYDKWNQLKRRDEKKKRSGCQFINSRTSAEAGYKEFSFSIFYKQTSLFWVRMASSFLLFFFNFFWEILCYSSGLCRNLNGSLYYLFSALCSDRTFAIIHCHQLKISRLIKECFFPRIYQKSRPVPDQLSPFFNFAKITTTKNYHCYW